MLRLVYRLLLYACPGGVRREYGREMEELFLHGLRTERRRRGRIGSVLACVSGLADLLAFATRAHWERWTSGAPPGAAHHSRRPVVILRDLRGAVRLARTQPALSGAILVILALGIGAARHRQHSRPVRRAATR
jgi:hypothetical protein